MDDNNGSILLQFHLFLYGSLYLDQLSAIISIQYFLEYYIHSSRRDIFNSTILLSRIQLDEYLEKHFFKIFLKKCFFSIAWKTVMPGSHLQPHIRMLPVTKGLIKPLSNVTAWFNTTTDWARSYTPVSLWRCKISPPQIGLQSMNCTHRTCPYLCM